MFEPARLKRSRNQKWICFLLLFLFTLLPFAFAGGDEIEMEDGSVLHGDIVTRNAAEIYLGTQDGVKRVEMSKIKTIRFGPVAVKKSVPDTASPKP